MQVFTLKQDLPDTQIKMEEKAARKMFVEKNLKVVLDHKCNSNFKIFDTVKKK